jgi:centrosomal protein CEP104
LKDIPFKRLGYLSLDSNERSGYQARELKSVYIDSMALLFKLVLQKCHLNNFNTFN